MAVLRTLRVEQRPTRELRSRAATCALVSGSVERIEVEALRAGAVFGGIHRIFNPVDSSGMRVLYQAENLATGTRHTLAVLHGPFVSDPSLRARFVREMRLTASIPSVHVARVLDAGQDDATRALYIVMEPLHGMTLSSALERRGPFDWPTALQILDQVADALRAAHARGIVHRDLKPASIFLEGSPRATLPFLVRVLDFGIAKALHPVAEGPPAAIASPAWMAPEANAFGDVSAPIGPQADVWSFGLLTFSLLTGKSFFRHADDGASRDAGLLETSAEALAAASHRAAELGAEDRLPQGFDGWFAQCVDRDAQRRHTGVQPAVEALSKLERPARAATPEPLPWSVPPPPVAPSPRTVEPLPRFADDQDDPEDTLQIPSVRVDPLPRPIDPPRAPGPHAAPEREAAIVSAPGQPASAHTEQAPDAPAPTWWLGASVAVGAGLVGAVLAVLLFVWPRAREAMPAAAAAQAAAPAGSSVLRVHGSNTIGAELAPALAEAFLRRRTGTKLVVRRRVAPDEMVVEVRDGALGLQAVEIAAHGSSTAFQDLGAGLCEVGMASRRIRDDEAAKLKRLGELTSAASEHVIALDGIAVIVNPANPISLLSKPQITDVFSGKARRWSDVGGSDEPIVVHARDDKSGTYDTFAHMVLTGHGLAADAIRHESSEELSDAVAADARAIGFIGLPYVRSAKAVMVQEEGSVPLLPSAMTVATEDYPLARRLYLYLPLGAPPAAHDFVDFVLSEDGQKVVAAAGFVDLRPECEPIHDRCTACTAEYRELVGDACRLTTDFRFDRASVELDGRALRDLQRVSSLMKRAEYRGKSIVLLGFSDARGSRATNLAISQERASIVAIQFRARGLDVAVERGFGADMPVSDNTTEDGRLRNRRVEIWLR